jgi:hypothetical protein
MTNSGRFKALQTRISELRNRFLPVSFSQSGNYSPTELDNARAFRVLVHAEIEHFFEERALDIADRAFDLFKTKARVSRPIVHLLSNIVGDQHGLPSELGTPITALSITGKVVAQYKHGIAKNNGIRIPNMLRILLPIGVLEAEIDAAWLSTTDGFGAKRGAAAHSASIMYTIDPQDDYQIVNQIMAGIRDLDVLLNLIKQKLR